jgi:hypothetical protein
MCVQDVPPGRRVDRDDLRRRIDVVALFWLLPGAPKGKWFEAEVKRVNSRNGTMKIRYLEGGSEDDVNIETEHVVLMENAVLNIEEPVVQKRDYVRRPTPKCPCGK